MAVPGGTVLVLPGIYPETLNVTEGVTIKAIGGRSGDVIIAPPGVPVSTIEVATTEPVILRGLTVYVPGTNGVRGVGAVDLTVESTAVIAVNPPAGTSVLVLVMHDAADGTRARMVVRDSLIDGGIPNVTPPPPVQSFGLRPQGDVDAVLERNVVRRLGGACIFTMTRADLGGELNVDILENDLDECHPIGRVAAIIVGPLAANQPSATRPLTATGAVNIIGNTFRNSTGHCLITRSRTRCIPVGSNGTGSSTSCSRARRRQAEIFPGPSGSGASRRFHSQRSPRRSSTTTSSGTPTQVFASLETRRSRSMRHATSGDRSLVRRVSVSAAAMRLSSSPAERHRCSARLPWVRSPEPKRVVDPRGVCYFDFCASALEVYPAASQAFHFSTRSVGHDEIRCACRRARADALRSDGTAGSHHGDRSSTFALYWRRSPIA
jgi:hypothetical protein